MKRRDFIVGGGAAGLLLPHAVRAMTGQRVVVLGQRSPYLGQVATRSQVPDSFNNALFQSMSRMHHFARDDISSLRLALANWYVNSNVNYVETGSGGTATFTASIEYPSGTFTQVKFNDSSSGTCASAATRLSDWVSVAIPKGATFYSRIYYTNSSGLVFMGHAQDTANGDAFNYGTTGISDRTMGGTIPDSDTSNCMAPVAIIAMTRQPSVFLLGDSRCLGLNDTYSGTSGNIGELARSVGPMAGYIKSGIIGDRADRFVLSNTLRRALAAYCSHVFCEYGVNDVGNGDSLNTIKTNLATIWGYFPGQPRWQTTVAPETDSTDSWATLANQTAKTNFDTTGGGIREQLNDYIRTSPGPLSGFWEIANVVESSQNSGKWAVNGTANWYTSDGVHESPVAYAAIQSSGAINMAIIRR